MPAANTQSQLTQPTQPTVDICYLAHQRHEFTTASLINLLKNTPWNRVNAFHIFTDGDDRAASMIQAQFNLNPITRRIGGPVAILNTAVEVSEADYIVKIDNDTMVPAGWLDYLLGVNQAHDVDLIGLEAWGMDTDAFPDDFKEWTASATETMRNPSRIRRTRHVGGIGLFRRSAFSHSQPRPARDGRYGFTEWQWANPHITKAFLNPPLPVFLLDHLPMEPWSTLSRQYESSGVQRRTWGHYPAHCSALWDWWVGAKMHATGVR
jgi:hypothetical protein